MVERKFVTLDRLFIGRAIPYGPNGELSAIHKAPLEGPVTVTSLGLTGDQQGDPRHHGGPDKAIHHYPADHYPHWQQQLPDTHGKRWHCGAFGENISTVGLTESDVCFGDIFALGSVRLQVSQARQPCWKLNHRFHEKDMAQRVQDSGRTGWYYRVLAPGTLQAGDRFKLIDRPHPDWPLTRILHFLFLDPLNTEALRAMHELPRLPASWQKLLEHRLSTGEVESWDRRLQTPTKTV